MTDQVAGLAAYSYIPTPTPSNPSSDILRAPHGFSCLRSRTPAEAQPQRLMKSLLQDASKHSRREAERPTQSQNPSASGEQSILDLGRIQEQERWQDEAHE